MNWKIRFQNGWFLTGLISLFGLIVVYVTGMFGVVFDFGPIQNILETLLYLFVGIGVVSDPSVKGITDSSITMSKTDISQEASELKKGE